MDEQYKSVLDKIVHLVEIHEIIKHGDLELKVLNEFPTLPREKILEALSTAAQDGLIQRFEVSLPHHKYRYFYIPVLAKLT